jgi:hypothetical protein
MTVMNIPIHIVIILVGSLTCSAVVVMSAVNALSVRCMFLAMSSKGGVGHTPVVKLHLFLLS